MKTKLLLVLFALLFLVVSPALAQDEVRKLEVDLKAKGMSQLNWYDNLDSSNIIFAPGDKFQLQVTVKNLGNRNQTWVQLTPKLPASVTSDSSLSFKIPQIAANQDYQKTVTLTVADKSKIQKILAKNDLSLTAKSEVGTQASDSLYFYTGNGTLGTGSTSVGSTSPTLPKTGPEGMLLGTLLSLGGAFGAIRLRKAARGY
jgi:uncharacterized repeat protein (TIGR01451 family)